MTKQEEIKGKILTLLVGVAQRTVNGFDATDQILSYLHSQGVVIKRERELPQNPVKADWLAIFLHTRHSYNQAQQDMLKAGYVAVEPLIEEKQNV